MAIMAFLTALFFLGPGAAAGEIPASVERAFANMQTELVCDYTRTQRNPDEVLVERFEDLGGQLTRLGSLKKQ